MNMEQARKGYIMANDTIKNLDVTTAKHAYDNMMTAACKHPEDADLSFIAGYGWAVMDYLKD